MVNRDPQPTIKTVARHAGVSPMTVSRVLRGGKNVRGELVDRVHASIELLGYRRNEQARSLRPGQRSGLIGVAITNIANPYYAEFVLGAEEVANAAGRGLLLGSTGEDVVREARLVSDFIGRQVEGLIVVPAGARAHLVAERLGGTPLVLASRAVAGLSVDTVLVEDVTGAYEATAALVSDGHTRIAFLGTTTSVFTGRRRWEGFQLAMTEAGLEIDPTLVIRAQQDVSTAELAMDALLDLPEPPSAVFCANNRNTIGAIRALKRRQRTTDVDVMIVAFDNFELADVIGCRMLVVDHDARELGRRAAALLIDQIEAPGPAGPPRTVELPTRLVPYGG